MKRYSNLLFRTKDVRRVGVGEGIDGPQPFVAKDFIEALF